MVHIPATVIAWVCFQAETEANNQTDSSNDDSSDNSSADSSSGDESTQHMSTAPSASGESDQSSSSSSDSDGEERSVQSSPTSAPSVPVAATKAPKKGPAKSPNKTTKPTSKGPEVSAEVAELMRTDKECEIQPSGTEDELNLLECTFRFPPEYSRLRVWLPEITDWCLDYSEGDPTLWVITPYAWYKIAGPLAGLLPHPSYRSVFKHVRSLFEASYLVAYVLKEWLPINKKVSYRATLQQVVELSLKGRYPVSAWLLMENCQFIRNQIADLVSDKDAYLDSMFFRQLQRVSDSYKYREERTKKELEEKELKRKQREQERLERKQKQRDERDKRKDKKDQEKREREKEKKYPVEDMELLSENAPNIIPLEGEKWRGVDSTLLGDLIMAWQTICTFSSYTAMKPISLEALAGCMTADQHDGTSAELTRIFVGFLRSILSEKSFASLMDNLVVEGTVKVGDLFANTERIYGIGERPYLDMLNAVTWQEILRQLMSKELGIDASIGHVEPLVGCEIVRQTLFMQVTSTPFNSPVDTTLRGLEDYVEIIKQPMDLGTIRKKLEDGCYEVPNGHELFASDVRLIWENAVLYNGEQSEIGRAALALSDIFEQDYRRLVLGRIQANENRIEGCKRVKEFLRKSEVSSSVPTYADIAYGLYAFDFHKLPLPFKVGALAWLCGEFVNLDSVRTHLETQVEREAVVLRAHKKQASEIEARRKESERQRRQKEKEFRKECIADGIPLNSRDAVTDEIKKKHEFIGDFYEELDAETIEHEAGFEEERKAQEEALTNELKGAITREYPVGKDRFHNCYWVFKNDTKKRLFVEKSDSGSFFVCDSRDQLDALLQWLNPKGVREMDLLKTMNRLKDDLLKEDEGHSVNTSHGNGVNEVEEAGTINLFPLPGGAVPPETFELPKDGGSVQSLLVVKKMLLSLEKHLSHAGSLLPDWDATGHWRERVETSSACTSLKESLSKLEDAVADSPKKKETIRASWKRKRREWRLGLDGSENPTQLALLVHVFLAECVNVEAFMDLYIKFDRKEWLKLRAKECRNFIPEIDKHVIYFGDGHVQALKDDAKVKKKRFTRQSDPPIAHATLLCVVKNISFHHGGGDPYALLGLQPVPDPSTHSCARQPGKLLCPSPSPLQRLSRILLRVVAKLKSHENAGPFLEPVSDRDFPEYKELILHPMDISKMETKTRQLAYRQSSEFLADAKLICSNCELFCEDRFPMLPPLARNLVELTEGWLRKLVKELRACEKELSVDDGGASSGASQSTAAPKSENAKPQDIPREIIAILRLENRLPEYVVDVQRYENAVSRQWQPGERFRILFRSPQGFPGDFYGGVTAGSLPFGDNGLLPWEALRVTWDEDDGADDSRINPWEADIVTEKRKTNHTASKVAVSDKNPDTNTRNWIRALGDEAPPERQPAPLPHRHTQTRTQRAQHPAQPPTARPRAGNDASPVTSDGMDASSSDGSSDGAARHEATAEARPSSSATRAVQEPNCDVMERRDHRRNNSSGNISIASGSHRPSDMGTATASSELVLQLQRLCQRQRLRSEERSFVRDVERVLFLLRSQPPAMLRSRSAGNMQDDDSSDADGDSEGLSQDMQALALPMPSTSDRAEPSLVEMEMLFDCISDLFDHRNVEVRSIAFEVINLCMGYYGDQLSSSFRRKIFHRLENHAAGDFKQRQKSLRLLTQEGRNLEPFSVELGWLLLQLLEESDDQRDLILLIQNILRRSPLALDIETVIAVTSIICGRCDLAWSRGDIDSCKRFLTFFHVLATHTLEHAVSTTVCLRTLCCMVNADGHGTWSIMKTLLNGTAGFQVLRGLISLLESPQLNTQWVLRGAVFFVGMSCWGSQRVAQLEEVKWAPILLALESVLKCNNGVVIFEVILSLQRLIKKYGDSRIATKDTDKRIVVEWDIILRIFKELRPWLSMNEEGSAQSADENTNSNNSSREATALVHPTETPGNPMGNSSEEIALSIHQTRIPKELLDTLAVVEELVSQGAFAGEVDEFFNVLEEYLPYLSEHSTLFLLKHRAKSAHPASDINWLRSLEAIVDEFFAEESMPVVIRQEALQVLQMSLWSSRNICEDRVIEEVLLPMLCDVYDDPHADIRRRGLDLITEVARQLESIKFDTLLDILANAVSLSEYDDSQQLAISGIVSLFSSYFNHMPPTRALRMYEIITATIETHRSFEVRKIALGCLTRICEANSDFRLQWRHTQLRTSRFLYVTSTAVRSAQTGACVPVARALRAMLTLASTETHAVLFRMAVEGIRTMLQNRTILTSIDISDMTTKLVSCIDYRAFGRAAVADELMDVIRKVEGAGNSSDVAKPRLDARTRCLTDTDIAQFLNSGSNSGSNSRANESVSPKASFRDSAATLCRVRFMTLGLEILELLAASYASALSPETRQQLLLCLIGALDVHLSVAEKDTFASGSASECYPSPIMLGYSTTTAPSGSTAVLSTRVVASSASVRPRPSMAAKSQEETNHNVELVYQPASQHPSGLVDPSVLKAVSPHSGFTSRMLSRLQSSASHSNLFHALSLSSNKQAITSSPHRDDRVHLQKVLHLLFDAEFGFVHVVTNAISLLTLHVHVDMTEHLDLLLRSSRVCFTTSEGDFRADVYAVVVEMLENVLHSIHTSVELPLLKQVLEVLLVGFQFGKSKQIAFLCHQLLCRIIFRSRSRDRAELAAVVLPTLRQCFVRSNSLLMEATIDFLMCYGFAKSFAPPPSLAPNNDIRSHNGNQEGRSRSWVYNNSILTITIRDEKKAQLTIRRSNCTNHWNLGGSRLHGFQFDDGVVRPSSASLKTKLATRSPNEPRQTKLHFPREGSRQVRTLDDLDAVELKPVRPSDAPQPGQALDDSENVALSSNIPRGSALSESYRPRSKAPSVRAAARGIKNITPEMYMWKSKANRKQVKFCLDGGGAGFPSPAAALPPLPAYDGVGGSPSYFCDTREADRVDRGSTNEPSVASVDEQHQGSPRDQESNQQRETDESSANDMFLLYSHQDASTREEQDEPFDPMYLMMQLFDLTVEQRPQLLRNDQALTLALNVLDRTPEFETLKIGLVYVRNGKQKHESDVLGNIGGSVGYLQFLRELGTITKLEGFTGYSGGLDVSNNSDGKFGLVYKDDCTQIVFHVATMMEAADEQERRRNGVPASGCGLSSATKKKRHIGNDFVHVVYKECDGEYDVNTLSGQFNDVHIIVQPLKAQEYRTEVHCKAGIQPFGPLFGTQIVSSAIVAEAVRLTCVHANVACRAFHHELVGFTMNCEERLKQIKQMGIRLATAEDWTLATH
ncbi:TPA: hypothetical protein N0F65_001210 [Lagenidium giganteum]|uniref:Uncharacterized protein n=1 Tax=Lagenidium giganteum TaxID=4803 RepID=A0AAV2Z5C4_9STRA|nr:TPA: hypothetical protein N0F65_001210 [Lagenidium giganteum]